MIRNVDLILAPSEHGVVVRGIISFCWDGVVNETGERCVSHPGSDQRLLDMINEKIVAFLDGFPGDRMIQWGSDIEQTDTFLRYRLTPRACFAILRRNALSI
jgi:hypothetical protein